VVHTLFENTPYIFNPLAIQTLLVAFGMFYLGILGLVREQGSPVSIVYFVLALGIGIWLFAFAWMYSATDEHLAMWWAKVAYAGISIIPAAVYHFRTYMAPEQEKSRVLVRAAWLLSAVFALLSIMTDVLFHSLFHYEWGFYPKFSLANIPFMIFFAGVMADSLLSYLKVYRDSEKGSTEAIRARFLLIAFAVGFLAALDFLASFGLRWYPLGYLAIFFFIVLSFHSIRRYQFMAITPAFAARQIIDTMNDALIVLDPDGIIKVVNEATCLLFGRPAQDLVGKRPTQGIAACSAIGEKLEAIMRSGAVRNSEVVCRPAESELKILSVSATIMRNPAGEPLATVCVVSDVTERRRAEEDREKLIVRLQDAISRIKRLGGMLPICSSCKKIRDDRGYWNQIELYIRDHTDAEFTHSLCPACAEIEYAELARLTAEARIGHEGEVRGPAPERSTSDQDRPRSKDHPAETNDKPH
jgi:PAS domain S-box-containing protein